jgi:hypothetical protein
VWYTLLPTRPPGLLSVPNPAKFAAASCHLLTFLALLVMRNVLKKAPGCLWRLLHQQNATLCCALVSNTVRIVLRSSIHAQHRLSELWLPSYNAWALLLP